MIVALFLLWQNQAPSQVVCNRELANFLPAFDTNALSEDGTKIAGRCEERPAIWNSESITLLRLPERCRYGYVECRSPNDSVLVGRYQSPTNRSQPFVWRRKSGIVHLKGMPRSEDYSLTAVSDNGVVLFLSESGIGCVRYGHTQWLFRHKRYFAGEESCSRGAAISSNGRVVVGTRAFSKGVRVAMVWNQRGVARKLLPKGHSNSWGLAVTPDGKAVILAVDRELYSWTQRYGFQELAGTNQAKGFDSVRGISEDASWLWGVASMPGQRHNIFYIWTKAGGLQEVDGLMRKAGLKINSDQWAGLGGLSSDRRTAILRIEFPVTGGWGSRYSWIKLKNPLGS